MSQIPTDPIQDLWAVMRNQGPGMADDLLDLASKNATKRLARADAVRAEIVSKWADAWTFLDAITNAMEQDSLLMLQRAETDDEYTTTRETLAFLQGAATMLVHEIVSSLKEGFLGAGISRWRALHEIAVTAIVLAHQDVDICQRYLDHGEVVRAQRLERHWAQPGANAPAQSERDDLIERSKVLSDLHTLSDQSVAFHRPYGWASPLMEPRRDGKRLEPTFERLEKLAGLSSSRVRVQDAHGFVHTDAAGLYRLLFPSENEMVLDRRASHIDTVAAPLCDTIVQVTSATHMGFEPEVNKFASILGLSAAGTCELAARGRAIFVARSGSAATE